MRHPNTSHLLPAILCQSSIYNNTQNVLEWLFFHIAKITDMYIKSE